MPDSAITHLRHVGVAMPDFDTEVAFYEGVWGLERVADDAGVVFLAAVGSPERYVLRLRRAPDKRLDLISFAVSDADAVDRFAADLVAAGVRLDREPQKLDTPGAGYGLRLFDPDGRLVELSADVEPRPYRDLEHREAIPRRLSHVVINSPNVAATKAFYEQHLGFRLSDWLEDRMCFLRCSPDHHSIAIAQGPHASLNHVSFEMRGIDEYMRGTGRLIRHGLPLLWGPGRHGAGDNTFSYFLDPAGNIAEYTTELEKIHDEDAWKPRVYSTAPEEADQWGTGGPLERMIPAMFNDPDKGLWTSAPL